jgi:predicted permease
MFFWPGFILIGFILVRTLRHGEPEKRMPIGRMLLQNASLPLGSIALALFCNHQHLVPPKPVWLVIEQFAGITVPLILFAVGVTLRLTMPRHDLKVVLLASLHRLVLGGFIGWLTVSLVSRLFTVDALTMKVIFLQAAMPTATMSPFFAEYTDMDEGLLGSIIAVATLLSLVTLPLWRIFLDGFYG